MLLRSRGDVAMLEVLTRWWQWLIALAVVVGLYLAAAAINRTWMFWAAVAAALVLAVGTVVVTKTRSFVRQSRERLRKYPELERDVKRLREELADANRQIGAERERADKDQQRALFQGRAETRGIFLAKSFPIPELIAAVKKNDELALIAFTEESIETLSGALYAVKSSYTGEVKGIVRVQGAGNMAGTVLLECHDRRVIPFWEKLAASAEVSTKVPDDIVLAECTIQEIDSGIPLEGSKVVALPRGGT
jgi:hypothetical protein